MDCLAVRRSCLKAAKNAKTAQACLETQNKCIRRNNLNTIAYVALAGIVVLTSSFVLYHRAAK